MNVLGNALLAKQLCDHVAAFNETFSALDASSFKTVHIPKILDGVHEHILELAHLTEALNYHVEMEVNSNTPQQFSLFSNPTNPRSNKHDQH